MSKLSFKPRFHKRTDDGHYFSNAPVHVATTLKTLVMNERQAIAIEGGSLLCVGYERNSDRHGRIHKPFLV